MYMVNRLINFIVRNIGILIIGCHYKEEMARGGIIRVLF